MADLVSWSANDSAKIEEIVKNHQNWTQIVKETLFSEGFLKNLLTNLGANHSVFYIFQNKIYIFLFNA